VNEVNLLFLCCIWANVALNLCVEVGKVEARGKKNIICFFFTLASVCQIAAILPPATRVTRQWNSQFHCYKLSPGFRASAVGIEYLHTQISCNQWMQELNLAVRFSFPSYFEGCLTGWEADIPMPHYAAN